MKGFFCLFVLGRGLGEGRIVLVCFCSEQGINELQFYLVNKPTISNIMLKIISSHVAVKVFLIRFLQLAQNYLPPTLRGLYRLPQLLNV